MSDEPFREEAWSREEAQAVEAVRSGRTAVANLHKAAPYGNALRWSRSRGLFARVDRGTAYGNPFPMRQEADREGVIEQFAAVLVSDPDLIARARRELRGKLLGCWCTPKACHGHVLAAVADCREERLRDLLDSIRANGWTWTCTAWRPDPTRG